GMPDSVSRWAERWLADARLALGARAAEVWAAGERLSLDEATAYALSRDQPDASILLSDRELEVAALLAQGYANRRIAHQLVISERTVEAHVRHTLAKLGLDSRLQIALWMSEHGIAIGGNTDAGGGERS